MNIDWSKAPEWANAVVAASTGTLYFVEAFGVRSKRRAVSNSDDCSRAADMTIKSYSWKLIEERPKKQDAWDGEGLPPVGMASCEYLGAHKYDEWTVVNIFAHYGHTVFVDFGDGWRAEKDGSRFRPIRTAEQVAAEEREKAIEEMVFGVCGCEPDGGNTSAFMVCGFLYDAGYRKQ